MSTKPRKSITVTMRLTDDTNARIVTLAESLGVSRADASARLIEAGAFWMAFQRSIMADAERLPSPDEIKAAFRTIEKLKARAA